MPRKPTPEQLRDAWISACATIGTVLLFAALIAICVLLIGASGWLRRQIGG